MIFKGFILWIFCLVCFCSCDRTELFSAGDKDIKIEAMRHSKNNELVFNVRIYPSEELSSLVKERSQQIMYRTDSLFYLEEDNEKIYPLSTEYIPSGGAKSLEFMVVFDNPGAELFQLPLNYQDKYINQQHYQLKKK